MRGEKVRGQMRREILKMFHVAIRRSRCLAVDGGFVAYRLTNL